jgi:hypothetical protein
MNTKIVKSIMFAFMLYLFCSINSYGFTNEPKDFRSINWGTNLNECTDMIFVYNDGLDKWYNKKNDKLKIGDVDLGFVGYIFYKDRFYAASISFAGMDNFNKLKEILFQMYGKGTQSTHYKTGYEWHGDKVDVGINFNDANKEGLIVYMYFPIKKEKEDNKLKEKSGSR